VGVQRFVSIVVAPGRRATKYWLSGTNVAIFAAAA
jgi:hypothetical protein